MADLVYQGKPLSLWLELLKDQDIDLRQEALVALRRIGGPALPGLIKIYKEGSKVDRYWTVRTLGQMGPEAKPAVAVVKLALKEADDKIRQEAANALERIDPQEAGKALGLWYRLRRLFKKPS